MKTLKYKIICLVCLLFVASPALHAGMITGNHNDGEQETVDGPPKGGDDMKYDGAYPAFKEIYFWARTYITVYSTYYSIKYLATETIKHIKDYKSKHADS